MLNNRLIVSSSPHVRSDETVQKIMLDVVIALMPALVVGTFFFGFRALLVTLISIGSCILFEHLWHKMSNKPSAISDLSAVVTGMLIAFNLPVTVPLWLPIVGSFFAIIVVKQLFGGLGQNFMNPALAARAFLLASWPVSMTKWVQPFTTLSIFDKVDVISSATTLSIFDKVDVISSATTLSIFDKVDVISSATPLGMIKGTEVIAGQVLPSYMDLFVGNIGGCIGETSALALILGGGYLLFRKVINWRIPTTFILTVAVMTFIFGKSGFFTGDALYHVLSGGLILGAFYMATDYSSSPVTPKGHIIMGIGCGIITSVIRLYGGYPEGVSYSILLMNVAAPLIDRYTVPKKFGEVKVGA